MKKITGLRSAKNIGEFAALLGFTAKGLSYVLYKIPAASKYYKFYIPKKSGELREIMAPVDPLKALQRRLSDLLYDCREEIQGTVFRRTLSHGYRKGQSIWDNAYPHTRKRYVLNVDLENFFPTFNFGRVRGFFLNDNSWRLHPAVATLIAQIACHENQLPQGSPCSPVISDLISNILDAKLVKFSKRHRVFYSRYADDLTFSTNAKTFPAEVAFRWSDPRSPWSLDHDFIKTIESAGFRLNSQKTRMQVRQSRQTVTGLVVNKNVNVSREYYRYARSMCDSLFRNGYYYKPSHDLVGPPKRLTTTDSLFGVLSYINFIKTKIHERSDPKTKPPANSFSRMYFDFLFYRTFGAIARPVLITEGKTDNVYLSLAIKHLAGANVQLSTPRPDGKGLGIQLLTHQTTSSRILGLDGGSAKVATLLSRFQNQKKKYAVWPAKFPTIVLIDNDSGASSIFPIASKAGTPCNLTSTEPFYRISDDLYVVKTHEVGPTGTSCIEDYFEVNVKSELVDGRTFDPKNEHDTALKYGKNTFARRVVVPLQGKVNWALFQPLLDRINAALADYATSATIP